MGPPICRIDEEEFRRRIHDLSKELYDMIQAYIFTVPTKTLIMVNKHHRPPSVHQVSRATRCRLLEEYYLCNRFWVMIDLASRKVLAWFRSLPTRRCRMLIDLRIPRWREGPMDHRPRTLIELQLELLIIYVHSRRNRGL